jgi:hypothetical protein
MTAPPDGLYLLSIRYPAAFRLPGADESGACRPGTD